jgi:CCR4-NOT complex subunit CAF16
LKPYKVLLCDEITVDLDILGRLDLLEFFKEECEVRGATIVYATHIFDGMADWMTHLAFTSNGQLKYGGAKVDIPEIQGTKHLLSTIEKWLRIDRDERRAREAAELADPTVKKIDAASHFQTRHMAYYR